MVHSEYYKLLDLKPDCSIDQIKKAYREKARMYHPDVNHSPDAKENFIKVTEAYDFLISNHDKEISDEEEFARLMEEWRKYRQERSRMRARFYAQYTYSKFKSSKYYKSTKELNGYVIIVNFSIAVMVLIYTIIGYIIKLKDPIPDSSPAIYSFILLLVFSLILFTVSFIYLRAYIETRKKRPKRKNTK